MAQVFIVTLDSRHVGRWLVVQTPVNRFSASRRATHSSLTTSELLVYAREAPHRNTPHPNDENRLGIVTWRPDAAVADRLGVSDWLHVHIIPEENVKLRTLVTSPGLTGMDMSSAWRSVLKRPDRYIARTPRGLIPEVPPNSAWVGWRQWLHARYGTECFSVEAGRN